MLLDAPLVMASSSLCHARCNEIMPPFLVTCWGRNVVWLMEWDTQTHSRMFFRQPQSPGLPFCVRAGVLYCGVPEECSYGPSATPNTAGIPCQHILIVGLFGFAGTNSKILSHSWLLHSQRLLSWLWLCLHWRWTLVTAGSDGPAECDHCNLFCSEHATSGALSDEPLLWDCVFHTTSCHCVLSLTQNS